MTLFEEVNKLSDDEVYEFVRDAVFAGGFCCPRCGCEEVVFVSTRRVYRCKHCGKWFSVKSVSILRKSHLTLKQWLLIFALFAEEKGLTATKLAKRLGIAYNTAYLALHKVRAVMRKVIEEDGSFKNVMGAFFLVPGISRRQRESKTPSQILEVSEHTEWVHIHLVEKQVRVLQGRRVFKRREKEQFGLGEVIRGVKSLLGGVYHGGCWKHTQRYLDEFCFRWNMEQKEYFWRVVESLRVEALPWKWLKAEPIVLLAV